MVRTLDQHICDPLHGGNNHDDLIPLTNMGVDDLCGAMERVFISSGCAPKFHY
jgi:hypothetical protein